MPEVEMHYLTFGENQTQTPHTNCQTQWWSGNVWTDFAATGPGQHVVFEYTVNFFIYKSILESDVKSFWLNLVIRPTGQRF